MRVHRKPAAITTATDTQIQNLRTRVPPGLPGKGFTSRPHHQRRVNNSTAASIRLITAAQYIALYTK